MIALINEVQVNSENRFRNLDNSKPIQDIMEESNRQKVKINKMLS